MVANDLFTLRLAEAAKYNREPRMKLLCISNDSGVELIWEIN
jgi:hypothetical protein